MYNRIEQYELEEAKKRMGTHTAGTGMTNTAAGTANTASMSQLNSAEKLQAKEDINNYHSSMY